MTKDVKHKHKLIEQGLCPQCGKPKDREGYYCSECLAKHNARRKADSDYFLSIGLCRVCGKNKIVPGKTYCADCLEKVDALCHKRYLDNPNYYRERNRISNKKRYDECKEQGICTRCRKRKAEHGRVMCRICLDKDAQKHALRYNGINADDRFKMGICRFCNEPVKDGYRTCEKHYRLCCESARKAKEKRLSS